MQQTNDDSVEHDIKNSIEGLIPSDLVISDGCRDALKMLGTSDLVAASSVACEVKKLDSVDRQYTTNLHLKARVTALELQCARLEKENEKLREQAFRNEEFLAAVAHDLKSSLTGGLRIFEVLKKGISDLTYRELLDSLSDSHQSMLRALWNILEAYRAKESTTLLRLEPIDVPELIRECCKQLASSIAINHISLDLQLKSQMPPVLTDKQILARIITNLLDNAIKFSPEHSSVLVLVDLEGEHLTIKVKDNGSGICALDQSQIFEKFWQSKRGPYSTMGTGLGLHLCKTLVEKLEGSVECVSSLGLGTEFIVRLPLMASF